MSEGRFVGFFRLVEACAHPGCPVCRCVIRDSRSYLDALLYEQVTDPDTRRAIRASWGFCNWHTWMLLEVEHSIFGSALIYEELVKLALSRTERLGERGSGHGGGAGSPRCWESGGGPPPWRATEGEPSAPPAQRPPILSDATSRRW